MYNYDESSFTKFSKNQFMMLQFHEIFKYIFKKFRQMLKSKQTWCSGVQLWWIIPMPPPRAMEMAISCSVTVSMGLETNGAFSVIFLVKALFNSTSFGKKSMKPAIWRRKKTFWIAEMEVCYFFLSYPGRFDYWGCVH